MFPTVEATENSHEKGGKKRLFTHTKVLRGSPPPRFGGRRALGIRTASTEKNGREIGVSGNGSDGELSSQSLTAGFEKADELPHPSLWACNP
jgi:hypothetical protein